MDRMDGLGWVGRAVQRCSRLLPPRNGDKQRPDRARQFFPFFYLDVTYRNFTSQESKRYLLTKTRLTLAKRWWLLVAEVKRNMARQCKHCASA